MQDTNMGANPYAAPAARVEQPFHADSGMQKSSRGARLGAYLLDFVIGVLCAAPIVFGSYQDYVQRATTGQSSGGGFGLFSGISLVLLLALAVYNIMLLYRSGQTLGKKLVGIRIVRVDGSRAGLGRILGLRYIVPGVIGAIPFVGFLFTLADPLWIFGEERRCIHDYLADTIVVDA